MKKHFFNKIELMITIGVVFILATIVASLYARSAKNAKITACEENLKQIGSSMNAYFADGKNKKMPGVRGTLKEDRYGWQQRFKFDPKYLNCPAERDRNNSTYAIHPYAAYSATFSKLQDHVVAGDTTFHTANEEINVLFGDGHVEDFSPDGVSGPYSGVYQVPNRADKKK